jgi:peptide/nickel transport system substrate-binding protein
MIQKFYRLVFVLVFLLTACSQAPQTAAAPISVTRAMTSEPSGLDPQGSVASGQNVLLPYLFDTLIYRDKDQSFKPYLAEKWETTPDGKQITFTLRKNITFTDGTALDAAAVKFTFERLMQQGAKSVLASAVTVIDSIDAVDATTVRFNLKEPSSTFLGSVSLPYAGIISPKAVQDEGDAFAQKPVGSGPFMLEKWDPGVAITLVKNPKFAWAPPVLENQAAPHVDKLIFKVIPDANQQVTAYQAGEVDFLFVNQPSQLAKLKADPNTTLVDAALNSLIYLGFNCKKAPFDDPKVRQALSYAVNKDELVKLAVGDSGEVAYAPLASSLPGYDASLKSDAIGYDPEKAKGLLKEAGFEQGADGAWTKDGQPFALSLLTSTRPPNQAIATILQNQFKAIGLDLKIEQLDSSAAQAKATKGDYDVMLWRYDWNDADALRIYLSSSRIGQTNRSFYSNPEVDALLEKASHEMDEAARNSDYKQAQQLILKDAPWQPLYTPKDTLAFNKALKGVVMGPMGRVWMNDTTR